MSLYNLYRPVSREVKDIWFEVLSKVSYSFINKKMCVMLNTINFFTDTPEDVRLILVCM